MAYASSRSPASRSTSSLRRSSALIPQASHDETPKESGTASAGRSSAAVTAPERERSES